MLLGAEGSPQSDVETFEQKENWKVYKAQLESLCQSLQYLMLQFQDRIGQLVRYGIYSKRFHEKNLFKCVKARRINYSMFKLKLWVSFDKPEF
jgi:hypothetical protein